MKKNTASQLLEKMLQTKNLTMDRFPSLFLILIYME